MFSPLEKLSERETATLPDTSTEVERSSIGEQYHIVEMRKSGGERACEYTCCAGREQVSPDIGHDKTILCDRRPQERGYILSRSIARHRLDYLSSTLGKSTNAPQKRAHAALAPCVYLCVPLPLLQVAQQWDVEQPLNGDLYTIRLGLTICLAAAAPAERNMSRSHPLTPISRDSAHNCVWPAQCHFQIRY